MPNSKLYLYGGRPVTLVRLLPYRRGPHRMAQVKDEHGTSIAVEAWKLSPIKEGEVKKENETK